MKFGIVVFPGSNCDHDAYYDTKHVLGQDAEFIWHKDTDLKGADVLILPGGFSYGDYLRTGAIARFSPIMREVQSFAAKGGPVLGVCNGFGSARGRAHSGAMLLQPQREIRLAHVHVRVDQTDPPFTAAPAKDRCCASRSPTAKVTISRRLTCWPAGSQPPGGFRYTTATADGRGQSERVDQRHRGAVQRSAERGGSDAASERVRVVARSADGLVILESAVQSIKSGVLSRA
jgi:hypothetical protein